MSKGSGRRLPAVSTETVSDNWDKIFGKKNKNELIEVDNGKPVFPEGGFKRDEIFLVSLLNPNPKSKFLISLAESDDSSISECLCQYDIFGVSKYATKRDSKSTMVLRLTKGINQQSLLLINYLSHRGFCAVPFNDKWIDIKVVDGAFHLIGENVLLVSFDAVYWSVHPLTGSDAQHDTWRSLVERNGKSVFVNKQNQVISSKNGLEWKVEEGEIKVGDIVSANRALKNGIKQGDFGKVNEITIIDSEIYLFVILINMATGDEAPVIGGPVYGPTVISCWDKTPWVVRSV